MNASTSTARDEKPPTPLSILLAMRQRVGIFLVFLLTGILLGLLVYSLTPVVYQAKGTFLIDKLPFGTATDNAVDAETERQLVQSLILSIPSEEMRKAIAAQVNVPDTDLAFTDHDRPVSLSGSNKRKANITVTATRNSRLGVVTAESTDPKFAAQVVSAVFEKLQNINKIAGAMAQIQSRLQLDQGESKNLVQELTTVSSDRIKYDQQNQALDNFIAQKHPLETFPAFAQDATLSNLKTQSILVDSEYSAIAAQSSLGAKLRGKKAEVDGLKVQLNSHLEGLVAALRSSLQIARTREASLRDNLTEVQKRMGALETLQAHLAKGLGDFKLREELLGNTDASLASEASVIVVVDPAYAIQRPVRPVLAVDLGLGMLLGMALGLGSILLLLQVRPPAN